MAKKSTKKRMDDTLLEMAKALHSIGETNAITMRELQEIKTPKIVRLKSKEIRNIRLKEKVSQAVFAKLLNISPETIRKWEQGERHPTGASLKLLNLVSAHGLQALY